MDWKLGGLIFALVVTCGPIRAQTLPSFLGVQLGAEFDMPKCVSNHKIRSYEQPVTPCWGDEVFITEPDISTGSFEVGVGTDNTTRPSGIKDARLIVVGGYVSGVTVSTSGLDSQENLLAALTAKFGAPTLTDTQEMRNRMGATFTRIIARWKLPGLDVGFLGMGGSIDHGIITVYTPQAKEFKDRQSAEYKARTQGAF